MTDAEFAAHLARVRQMLLRVGLEATLAHFDEMNAAGEPGPNARLPVMPANALRRQRAPGGVWTPGDG